MILTILGSVGATLLAINDGTTGIIVSTFGRGLGIFFAMAGVIGITCILSPNSGNGGGGAFFETLIMVMLKLKIARGQKDCSRYVSGL